MKTKYFYLAALASLTLASCSSDDFIAEAPPVEVENTMSPIMFNSSQNAFTRADFVGKDAATKLGNKFVVFGYKGSETRTPGKATEGVAGGKVFDNYLVEYAENTANTTESNTKNWEYVGKGVIKHATDNGITKQTIKYWDYSQSQYDFIAWSTGSKTAIYEGTPDPDEVLVSEIQATPATSTSTPATTGLTAAYTFTGTADDLKECYVADLVTVYKGTATGTGTKYGVVENGYQQPVTLKFRQLGTKVRIGLYETVPGYSVKDVKFYSAAATALAGDATDANAKIFTTEANGIYKEGTYTVYFPTVDTPNNIDNNQAHIDFSPKTGAAQETTVNWGGLNYTYRESGESSQGPDYLGRTSNTASFAGDADKNYYVVYLPNPNGTNLNLRVNYTLESIDGSRETIVVKGATAQVPSIYTAWKPGYAYTYLFKISDKTNGFTGNYNPLYPDDLTVNSDPAGLYPITFDAVVVNAEEGKVQETITTISTPSITTYQKGSDVVNKNEYDHATGAIFVTVNDGGAATYQAVDPVPAENSPVAGYYTEENVYTPASGTVEAGTEYYSMTNDTYNKVTLEAGSSAVGYYVKTEKYTACGLSDVAVSSKTYYSRVSTLESGKLVTLQNSGDGMAALYTLPADKLYTEAEVVDALQMQEDDAPTTPAGTIKGRSGLVLTPATFTLEPSIEYGVDGNTINLTALPNPTGTGTYSANAMKFTAADAGTYAFVYTKTAKTGTDTKLYQPKTFASGASVKGYYRYTLKAATTPVDNQHTGDVEKGVTYFEDNDASTAAITAFMGQTVDNLFTRSGSNTPADPYVYTPARGYAQTGTTYYYTTNGQTYTEATAVAYANFKSTPLYTDPAHTAGTEKDSETPANGQAYYDGNGKYCVIYPQRTNGLYVFTGTDTTVAANVTACDDDDEAVDGMVYFDMYSQNNGVYYVKIIKVQ